MGEGIDHYDLQNAVEGEARDRRHADDQLRELVEMRVRELQEEIRELREQTMFALSTLPGVSG